MTVGGISSGISSVQFLRAKQAFENTNKLAKENEILKNGFSEEDVKISISSANIKIEKQPEELKKNNIDELNNKKIGEIKQFIEKNNYYMVEDEDLKQALSTGKSILANYTA
jgi:anti-sigma28 factor (negative regulator of flagellin synthesis)